MLKSFSNYSKKRKAILQQVKRLEKRGYVTKEKYKLPTVKELKAMPADKANKIVKSAAGYKTSAVRRSSYKIEEYTVKRTGEVKTRKIGYIKAAKEERSMAAKKGARRQKWHEDFIKAAPDDLKDEAKEYIGAVKEGYSGTFTEYLDNAGEEPDALETFNKKIEVLKESDTETANALQDLFDKYDTYDSDALESRFAKNNGNLPEFDYHYENGHLDTTEVLKMARIITGKPLSGTEALKLRQAIDKDTGA